MAILFLLVFHKNIKFTKETKYITFDNLNIFSLVRNQNDNRRESWRILSSHTTLSENPQEKDESTGPTLGRLIKYSRASRAFLTF